MILYFNSSAVGAGHNNNWSTVSNWWENSGSTVHHGTLPTSSDDIIVLDNINTIVGNININSLSCSNYSIIASSASVLSSTNGFYFNSTTPYHKQISCLVLNGNCVFDNYYYLWNHIGFPGMIVNGNCVFNTGSGVVNPFLTTFSGSVIVNSDNESSNLSECTITQNLLIYGGFGTSLVLNVLGNCILSGSGYSQCADLNISGSCSFFGASNNQGNLTASVCYFHDSSSNLGGYIAGSCYFYDSSSNIEDNGLVSYNITNINGNCYFYSSSLSTGIITGTCSFYTDNVNYGIVTGSLFTNRVISGSISLVGTESWNNLVDGTMFGTDLSAPITWSFHDNSILNSNYNPNMTLAPASFYFLDSSMGFDSNLSGNLYCYSQSALLSNTIFGNCFFYNSSTFVGTSFGNIYLYDQSYGLGTINGNCYCYDMAINESNVIGDSYWYDISGNGTTSIGNSYFYDSSVDFGISIGNSYFYDTSTCTGGTITGSCYFNDFASNGGYIDGTGSFYNNSYNGGYINGNGYFYNSSSNFDYSSVSPVNALLFDGTSNFASVLNSSTFFPYMGTWEFWQYVENYVSNTGKFAVGCLDGWQSNGILMDGVTPNRDGHSSGVNIYISGSQYSLSSSYTISPGWHHFASTWGDGGIRFFIDGEIAATASCFGTIDPALADLYLSGPGARGYLPCCVGEFKISNVVRYTSSFIPATSSVVDGSTVAYWNMGNLTGSSIPDSTGNGHTMILNGSTLPTLVPAHSIFHDPTVGTILGDAYVYYPVIKPLTGIVSGRIYYFGYGRSTNIYSIGNILSSNVNFIGNVFSDNIKSIGRVIYQ